MPALTPIAALAALLIALAPAAPHAQKHADPAKVLRVAFPIAETGFDPQATSDLYSGHVQRGIFEPLLTYDYLARPYKLAPLTAAALPEITDGGKTWTIRIKPGIFFADDPAFKGRKRELTAQDFVYAWKRLLDPRVRSPYLWYLDGKLVGADKVLAKAKEAGKLDYDAEIEGLRAVDKLHAAAQAGRARLHPDGLHGARRDVGSRARGRRGLRRCVHRVGDGESGRHGTLQARRVAARPEDRAGGEPELPRGDLPDVGRAGRRAARSRA